MPDSCCTYLSYGSKAAEATYGIADGLIENDTVTRKTLTAYAFDGTAVKCGEIRGGGACYLSIIIQTFTMAFF